MAKPTTTSFANFKILLEDQNSPNSYIAPCGFVSKSLDLTAQTSETVIPDCDDPEAAAWTEASVTSKSAAVSGNGVMAAESYEMWQDAWDSGESINCRVQIGSIGYWAGALLVTNLGAAVQLANDGSKVQLNVQARNASAWVWHAT